MPFSHERAEDHDFTAGNMIEKLIAKGVECYEGDWRKDETDILVRRRNGSLLPIDVKTVNADGRVSISVRQFNSFERRYPDLLYAIAPYGGSKTWEDTALVTVPQLEPFFSHIEPGDGITRNAIDFRIYIPPPFWLPPQLPLVYHQDDEQDNDAGALLEPLQLGLDGREIPVSRVLRHRHLGAGQLDVIKRLSYFAATATEIGTHMHTFYEQSLCGQYARDAKYDGPYRGLGCCREASSRGSAVLKSLEHGPIVKRDDARWTLAPEDWTAV